MADGFAVASLGSIRFSPFPCMGKCALRRFKSVFAPKGEGDWGEAHPDGVSSNGIASGQGIKSAVGLAEVDVIMAIESRGHLEEDIVWDGIQVLCHFFYRQKSGQGAGELKEPEGKRTDAAS